MSASHARHSCEGGNPGAIDGITSRVVDSRLRGSDGVLGTTVGSLVVAVMVACAAPVNTSNIPEGHQQLVVRKGEENWRECPPGMPEGCRMAVLEGHPKTEGLFTVRLFVPKPFELPCHTHPQDERVMILEGEVSVVFDEAPGATFRYGDYYVNRRDTPHVVWTQGPAAVQITGFGPWEVRPSNPTSCGEIATKAVAELPGEIAIRAEVIQPELLEATIAEGGFVAVLKGTPEAPADRFSSLVLDLFQGRPHAIVYVEVGSELARSLIEKHQWPTIPMVFHKGELIGGADGLAVYLDEVDKADEALRKTPDEQLNSVERMLKGASED